MPSLSADLSKTIGEPVTLFAAHDNPFVTEHDCEGSHAMIFETLAGQKMISLHRPNAIEKECAAFLPFG